MKFLPAMVHGAYIIDLERRIDERGFFARTWCQREFAAHGLTHNLAQVNLSHNLHRGTLRGLHFQEAPRHEAKLVSCVRGALYDVVVDLRPDSPTYLTWDAAELTDGNHRMFYVPEGCAHGFQTLADDTQMLYLMSDFYAPQWARGVRYDDQAFSIKWPLDVACISDADRHWPDYRPQSRTARAQVHA